VYADLLIHTATVERRVAGKDRFRQPRTQHEPQVVLPCRLESAQGKGETFSERSRDVIEVTHKLFLLKGADLREKDLVTVTDPDGLVLVESGNVVLVKILYDSVTEHHRMALLGVVREAT
jgi:hypothetical protein